MDILITKSTRSAQFSSIEMSDGKRSVYIGRGASGQITICALNASHRAWRGPGRVFPTFEEAGKAYKSGFMRAAIAMAPAYI